MSPAEIARDQPAKSLKRSSLKATPSRAQVHLTSSRES